MNSHTFHAYVNRYVEDIVIYPGEVRERSFPTRGKFVGKGKWVNHISQAKFYRTKESAQAHCPPEAKPVPVTMSTQASRD
jgi:hypothetical protein